MPAGHQFQAVVDPCQPLGIGVLRHDVRGRYFKQFAKRHQLGGQFHLPREDFQVAAVPGNYPEISIQQDEATVHRLQRLIQRLLGVGQ